MFHDFIFGSSQSQFAGPMVGAEACSAAGEKTGALKRQPGEPAAKFRFSARQLGR